MLPILPKADDDLALRPAAFKVGERLPDLFEREHPVKDRLELATFNQAAEFGEFRPVRMHE